MDQQQHTSLRKAIILDNKPTESAVQTSPLTAAIELPANEIPISESLSESKISADEPSKPAKSVVRKPLAWFAVGVIVLAVAELYTFTQDVISGNDWLGGLWLVAFAVGSGLAVKAFFSQWRSLKKLKLTQQHSDQANAILNGPSIGRAQDLCERIAAPLKQQYPQQLKKWRTTIEPHHMDAEIIHLFELQVLQDADKKALNCVTRHASASGAMIAVSPFALLDMAIVLWRNLVMLDQISRAYGLKLNYWSRIKLIKQIFKNMLYAGAAEILSDAGNYALGAGVTGKLSSRLAQGLGAGVLTSRIGLKTIAACRPLPFSASKMPGLSKMTQQLLVDLKKSVS